MSPVGGLRSRDLDALPASEAIELKIGFYQTGSALMDVQDIDVLHPAADEPDQVALRLVDDLLDRPRPILDLDPVQFAEAKLSNCPKEIALRLAQ